MRVDRRSPLQVGVQGGLVAVMLKVSSLEFRASISASIDFSVCSFASSARSGWGCIELPAPERPVFFWHPQVL